MAENRYRVGDVEVRWDDDSLAFYRVTRIPYGVTAGRPDPVNRTTNPYGPNVIQPRNSARRRYYASSAPRLKTRHH